MGLVPDSLLRQLEERLNSGGDAPGALFLELRKAALLRLFRSMAVEMELEVRVFVVCDQGNGCQLQRAHLLR